MVDDQKHLKGIRDWIMVNRVVRMDKDCIL